VSLFKRRGRADEDAPDDATDDTTDDTTDEVDDEGPDDGDDGPEDESADDEAQARPRGERTAALQAAADLRKNGPFDLSEVEDTAALLDLGAILVAPSDGMELRLELSEDEGNVVGVTVLMGESAVQVQAFAAPRSEGIWDEVREEIAAGITQQGGTADENDGPFGRELLARVPAQDDTGRPVFQPARFAGVDGPRWFLRAVFTGAAVDPGQAGSVEEMVRSLVVVRGQEAMAPRELLPLKLPEMPGDPGSVSADGPGSADDLNPFERGPEITEIR
jgi:Protein of unknown function (DUF3710)